MVNFNEGFPTSEWRSPQELQQERDEDMIIMSRVIPLIFTRRADETASQIFQRIQREVPEFGFLDKARVEAAMDRLSALAFELEYNGRPRTSPHDELNLGG